MLQSCRFIRPHSSRLWEAYLEQKKLRLWRIRESDPNHVLTSRIVAFSQPVASTSLNVTAMLLYVCFSGSSVSESILPVLDVKKAGWYNAQIRICFWGIKVFGLQRTGVQDSRCDSFTHSTLRHLSFVPASPFWRACDTLCSRSCLGSPTNKFVMFRRKKQANMQSVTVCKRWCDTWCCEY